VLKNELENNNTTIKTLFDNEDRRVSIQNYEFAIPETVKAAFEKYTSKKHKDKISLKQPEQQMQRRKPKAQNKVSLEPMEDCDREVVVDNNEAEQVVRALNVAAEIANRSRLITLQNTQISDDEASFDINNSSGFLTLQDFESGLVNTLNEEKKVKHQCGERSFYANQQDIYNCWVPNRAIIVD
jgi:hypothetical protein